MIRSPSPSLMLSSLMSALAMALTLPLVACASGSSGAAAAPPAKVLSLNSEPGAMVDVEKSLAIGFITVVDFWADYCAPCKTIEAELMAGIADFPDIVVRKVDVGPGDSDVAKAYKLGGLPHLRIFDRKGRLRYQLVGDDAHEAAAAAKKLREEK